MDFSVQHPRTALSPKVWQKKYVKHPKNLTIGSRRRGRRGLGGGDPVTQIICTDMSMPVLFIAGSKRDWKVKNAQLIIKKEEKQLEESTIK
jgi:hypothetical protein